MKPTGRRALPILGLIALLSFMLAACASVDKETLEERLLELPKNRPVAAVGLGTVSADIMMAGEKTRVDYSYLELKTRGAAGTASPERPTLVFVHGTPSTLFTWTGLAFGTDQFRGLAADFDIYAVEVIGHGVTRSAAAPYSFAKCAEYVSGFLDALDLRDVCLVGQSYGGEFAWRAALLNPERVSRLVLIDSSGYPREEDGFLSEEVAMREMWLAPIGYLANSREKITTALAPHFSASPKDDVVDEMFWVCENSDNWGAMIDLVRDENGLGAAWIPNIRVPTLLVWGDRDLAYPAERDARLFAADLPDAQLEVIEDCGHYPQEERPEVLVPLIRKFLTTQED